MLAAMAGQEGHVPALDGPDHHWGGWLTPRRVDLHLGGIVEERVEPRAAEDADVGGRGGSGAQEVFSPLAEEVAPEPDRDPPDPPDPEPPDPEPPDREPRDWEPRDPEPPVPEPPLDSELEDDEGVGDDDVEGDEEPAVSFLPLSLPSSLPPSFAPSAPSAFGFERLSVA